MGRGSEYYFGGEVGRKKARDIQAQRNIIVYVQCTYSCHIIGRGIGGDERETGAYDPIGGQNLGT
jgi:hypothetical protein